MHIHLTNDELTVEFTGSEKIWGVHGNFRIPRNQIASAWKGMPKTTWRELRIPGSFLPGVIKAGTYVTPRGKEYWYVSRAKRYPVTIELKDHTYKRLVLGVEDPASIQSLGLPLANPPKDIGEIVTEGATGWKV